MAWARPQSVLKKIAIRKTNTQKSVFILDQAFRLRPKREMLVRLICFSDVETMLDLSGTAQTNRVPENLPR
jgi:hypothetical protein